MCFVNAEMCLCVSCQVNGMMTMALSVLKLNHHKDIDIRLCPFAACWLTCCPICCALSILLR